MGPCHHKLQQHAWWKCPTLLAQSPYQRPAPRGGAGWSAGGEGGGERKGGRGRRRRPRPAAARGAPRGQVPRKRALSIRTRQDDLTRAGGCRLRGARFSCAANLAVHDSVAACIFRCPTNPLALHQGARADSAVLDGTNGSTHNPRPSAPCAPQPEAADQEVRRQQVLGVHPELPALADCRAPRACRLQSPPRLPTAEPPALAQSASHAPRRIRHRPVTGRPSITDDRRPTAGRPTQRLKARQAASVGRAHMAAGRYAFHHSIRRILLPGTLRRKKQAKHATKEGPTIPIPTHTSGAACRWDGRNRARHPQATTMSRQQSQSHKRRESSGRCAQHNTASKRKRKRKKNTRGDGKVDGPRRHKVLAVSGVDA